MAVIEIKGVKHCGNFDLQGTYTPSPDKRGYWDEPLILVKGRNYAGYSIGFIPHGKQDRQVYQGPMVPGPWAFIGEHASVIDTDGGTRRVIQDARDKGLVYEVEVGDTLIIEGVAFKLSPLGKFHDKNHLKLEVVTNEES